MPTINSRNHGYALGRLTNDPVVHQPVNGLAKVIVNVSIYDNFTKQKRGNNATRHFNFTALLANGVQGTIYDNIHKGDLVAITYELDNDVTDGFRPILKVIGIDRLEPKIATEARLKSRQH